MPDRCHARVPPVRSPCVRCWRWALSLGLHVALAGLMLGTAVWRGWQLTKTVEIELVSTQIKEVQQLPFGPPPPPPGEAAPGPAPAQAGGHRRRGRAPGRPMAAPPMRGAPDGGPGDAGTDASGDARGDGGADTRGPRPRDLRQFGPEGSRLTAILRLDRLRDSPEAPQTIAAVDRLLMNLPDRRRLLDGTGLDLYRDFDVILIATPNPLDDAVTFLAARHHLTDAAPDGRARARAPRPRAGRSPGAPRAGDRWGCGGRAGARGAADEEGPPAWSATIASWCCRSRGWPSWRRPPTPRC